MKPGETGPGQLHVVKILSTPPRPAKGCSLPVASLMQLCRPTKHWLGTEAGRRDLQRGPCNHNQQATDTASPIHALVPPFLPLSLFASFSGPGPAFVVSSSACHDGCPWKQRQNCTELIATS